MVPTISHHVTKIAVQYLRINNNCGRVYFTNIHDLYDHTRWKGDLSIPQHSSYSGWCYIGSFISRVCMNSGGIKNSDVGRVAFGNPSPVVQVEPCRRFS